MIDVDALADEITSAANIVTNGGFYEIDTDAVARCLMRALATAEAEAAELRAEVERLRGPLQLFLRLMDDDSYDFGELCEEFVPIARAALTGGTPHE